MLDIDTEDKLVEMVGGKFALTTILQKRMVELNRGAPPLVKVEGDKRDLRRVVCQEILEGKIELATREEVSYAFDLAFQQKSYEKFMEIKKSGKTIVYVTHNLEDVLKLCDRVVLMFKGFIADIGDPSTIIDKYRTVVEKSPEYHKEDLANKIENFYYEILERPPDQIGILEYIYQIRKGIIKLEDIPKILKNSEEYAARKNKT